MKKTKEKILDAALELFNSRGLSQVTLRTIARKLGISQGNLNYHFKKREDIIAALYFRLIENIYEQMSETSNDENILRALFDMSKSLVYELFEFRFIMLDFAQVMRENEVIREHFQELQANRKLQFAEFFELLINSGLMRKERLQNEYQNLYSRLQILGDFWISSAEIAENSFIEKSIPKYLEIINQTIFPYLTEKGRKEYQLIILDR